MIYGDLNFPSGGFLYDRKLIEHLEQQGHQTQVIAMPWTAYFNRLFQNFDAELLQNIEDANLDILLQDELNHASLFLLNRKIKVKINISIISIVHHLRGSEKGSWLAKIIFGAIEQRYLKSLDAIIANSQTTLNSVKALLSKNIPMLIAKPGGDRFNQLLSRQQIKSRVYKDGPLKILFLGALIRRKSPDLILEAIRDLPKGSFRVFFAGTPDADPSFATLLLNMTIRYKLVDDVQFLGHLSENDLILLMNKCHVLIVPSSYEGYGIAYVEAMGFGMLAIARNTGASGEIIEHEQNGFLLESGNSRELAKILARVHQDRDLLFRMSLAARKRYKELPGWAESMNKIEKFLIDIDQGRLLDTVSSKGIENE